MNDYSATEAANRRLVLEVYERVLNPIDSARVDDYFRPDYIQHSPLAQTGAQGLKDFLDWARANSPDAVHHVKRVLADGAFVMAHVHVIIHPGDRGNAVIDIFRIEDGRIAEHWDAAQPVPEQSNNDNGMF